MNFLFLLLTLSSQSLALSVRTKYKIGNLVSLTPVEVKDGVKYSVCTGLITGISISTTKYDTRYVSYYMKISCEGYPEFEKYLPPESIVKTLEENHKGMGYGFVQPDEVFDPFKITKDIENE